jgi:CHAT domain-containing protein/tetratricopeptide (TPR) repeat protein
MRGGPDGSGRIAALLDEGRQRLIEHRPTAALIPIEAAVAASSSGIHADEHAEALYLRGRALRDLGRYAEAARVLSEAGMSVGAARSAERKGRIQHALGEAYLADIQYEAARDALARAVAIRVGLRDVAGEGRSRMNLAIAAFDLGRYAEAQSEFASAEAAFDKSPQIGELERARLHNAVGALLALLGQYDAAMDRFDRALRQFEAHGEQAAWSETLRNEAIVAYERERFTAALTLFEDSRRVAVRVGALDEAKSLNGIGQTLVKLDRAGEARAILERALELLGRHADADSLAQCQDSLGDAYRSLGMSVEAQAAYLRALSLWRAIGYVDGERDTLYNLGRLYAATDRIGAAIAFLKLSIATSERLRSDAANLGAGVRATHARRLEKPYYLLAHLLVEQRRYRESIQVMLLLKEDDLRRTFRPDGESTRGEARLVLTEDEQAFAQWIADQSVEVAGAMRAVAALNDRVARGELADDSKEYAEATGRLNQALAAQEGQFRGMVRRLATASGGAGERAEDFAHISAELAEPLRRLRDAHELQGLGAPAALAVTWVPGERGLAVLVSSADVTIAEVVPVSESRLTEIVGQLRLAIAGRSEDYRGPARELYELLIRPAERLFGQLPYLPEHLLINAPGTLRDIPYATLLDPQTDRPLIERYSLSLVTAHSVDALGALPEPMWRIAALGTGIRSPAFGDVPLVMVRDELCRIVRDDDCQGAIGGRRFVDGQFDRARLANLIGPAGAESGANTLHLATHYSAARRSLLLGSGESFPIDNLRRMAPRLGRFDLMTLSACETAAGSGGVESLAGLLQELGARSVVATLWEVADAGTDRLMADFYATHGAARRTTKAQALRHAQLSLLNDPEGKFVHPYYWAPFVLMGGWL